MEKRKPHGWDEENQKIFSDQGIEEEYQESKSSLREQVIDASIASLYLTSGVVGLLKTTHSERAAQLTDISASSIWLVDSACLSYFALKRFFQSRKKRKR